MQRVGAILFSFLLIVSAIGQWPFVCASTVSAPGPAVHKCCGCCGDDCRCCASKPTTPAPKQESQAPNSGESRLLGIRWAPLQATWLAEAPVFTPSPFGHQAPATASPPLSILHCRFQL